MAAADARDRLAQANPKALNFDEEEWSRVLAGRPQYTIYDTKPPLASFSEPPNSIKHLLVSSTESLRIWGLSIIARRVCRLVRFISYRVPVNVNQLSPAMAVVLNLLPPPQDGLILYNSMLRFRTSLPAECRVWDSLEPFHLNANLPLLNPSNPPAWTLNTSHLFLEFFFIATLVMLHQPTINSTARIYPVQYKSETIFLTSAEVLVAAQRIVVYMIRCVHAVERVKIPFSPADVDSPSARAIPVNEQYPPSPAQLADSPMIAFCVFSISAMVISCVLPDMVDRTVVGDVMMQMTQVVLPFLENFSRVGHQVLHFAHSSLERPR